MKECGYTQEKLACAVGISKSTLNLKLNNKAAFYHPEMMKICEALNITGTDVYTIFFTLEVEKNSTSN
jgi:DNA-binding XRE family transcriptional regulator